MSALSVPGTIKGNIGGPDYSESFRVQLSG